MLKRLISQHVAVNGARSVPNHGASFAEQFKNVPEHQIEHVLSLKVEDLRLELRARGDKEYGKKVELQTRLLEQMDMENQANNMPAEQHNPALDAIMEESELKSSVSKSIMSPPKVSETSLVMVETMGPSTSDAMDESVQELPEEAM